MEELARPQRLPDAVEERQPGHRLVRDLWVDADQLGAGEHGDEVQRVPDRGQEDVAARLVGLRLEREAQVVALGDDVVHEHVDRLAVALERVARVLGRRRPRCPRARPRRRTPRRPARAPRSIARIALPIAARRTLRSLEVNAPSLKAGWPNRFVVAIPTPMPVSSSAALNRATIRSASAALSPRGRGRCRAGSRPRRRARRACGPSRPGRAARGWARRTGRGPGCRRSTDRR